jgi:hypothetical protein
MQNPRGLLRWKRETVGLAPETEQFDSFVLGMKEDPTDPEYTYLVRVNKGSAG